MTTAESRSLFASYLNAHPPKPLAGAAAPVINPERHNKAGILPYLPATTTENWRFYVMQPVRSRPELTPPAFQICKGTRMAQMNGVWKDIKDKNDDAPADAEPLVVTALREGEEEIGLIPDTIKTLWDAGEVTFTSAKAGTEKRMWLFAAEMKPDCTFLPDLHSTTEAVRWATLAEFEAIGRADHLAIIKAMIARLQPVHF